MIKKLTILFVVLAVLLFGRLWFGSGSLPHIWNIEDQIAALSSKNEAIQARNRKLEAEIEGLKENLDAIEARARNDFGMIRRGESFYQVILKDKQKPKADRAVTGMSVKNSQENEHNE